MNEWMNEWKEKKTIRCIARSKADGGTEIAGVDNVEQKNTADVTGMDIAGVDNDGVDFTQSATEVDFDETFKVVPTIYYQLFTMLTPAIHSTQAECRV